MSGTQPGLPATILQFPKGGRTGRPSTRVAATVVRPARFAPQVIAESGWYHDEAMREEAEQGAETRKPN